MRISRGGSCRIGWCKARLSLQLSNEFVQNFDKLFGFMLGEFNRIAIRVSRLDVDGAAIGYPKRDVVRNGMDRTIRHRYPLPSCASARFTAGRSYMRARWSCTLGKRFGSRPSASIHSASVKRYGSQTE